MKRLIFFCSRDWVSPRASTTWSINTLVTTSGPNSNQISTKHATTIRLITTGPTPVGLVTRGPGRHKKSIYDIRDIFLRQKQRSPKLKLPEDRQKRGRCKLCGLQIMYISWCTWTIRSKHDLNLGTAICCAHPHVLAKDVKGISCKCCKLGMGWLCPSGRPKCFPRGKGHKYPTN